MSAERIRPTAVTIAALLHFAIALAFASIPVIGLLYGADVQAAAEAETARQGQDPALLAANGLAFDEHGVAIWAPFAIAAAIALVGVILLAGKRIGRLVSFIVLPLVLAGNALIMASNATAAAKVQALFDASGDATVRSLDAAAILDAAFAAYPDWLPALEGVRFAVVTAGCVLGVVLLALRPAREYFRKA
ncbi:hypothetical protein [Glycomyces algeriensis]|uniref:Uncharacterized protein n=1 Tax=Glycomyces algeriensis TaxID=256037 RepID=A0A9W6G5T3_9ACTN|nr:hypothetical protein [Glycomyces algeriensis]MDA1368382.1 hypothetical protein [Glycomyces algeriensis]MDR7353188.1 cytochrome b561 [Glycomyces algeriensis]GLI40882.1 hypothetical protein GALLR39Z86_07320 [Glycomyces algeriensis]